MNGKEYINEAVSGEENLDLPEYFRPVAAKFGREMFSLVMNAGVAGQAASYALNDVNALRLLITSYNQLSNAYVAQKGWKEEELAACNSAIQLAFAGQIQIAEKKLILPTDMH